MTTAPHEIEFAVMYALAEIPMSPKELTLALGFSYMQIKYTVQNLRECDCIRRVPGTHLMELSDVSL